MNAGSAVRERVLAIRSDEPAAKCVFQAQPISLRDVRPGAGITSRRPSRSDRGHSGGASGGVQIAAEAEETV